MTYCFLQMPFKSRTKVMMELLNINLNSGTIPDQEPNKSIRQYQQLEEPFTTNQTLTGAITQNQQPQEPFAVNPPVEVSVTQNQQLQGLFKSNKPGEPNTQSHELAEPLITNQPLRELIIQDQLQEQIIIKTNYLTAASVTSDQPLWPPNTQNQQPEEPFIADQPPGEPVTQNQHLDIGSSFLDALDKEFIFCEDIEIIGNKCTDNPRNNLTEYNLEQGFFRNILNVNNEIETESSDTNVIYVQDANYSLQNSVPKFKIITETQVIEKEPQIEDSENEINSEVLEDTDESSETLGHENLKTGDREAKNDKEMDENLDQKPKIKSSRLSRYTAKARRVRGKSYEGYTRRKGKSITRTEKDSRKLKERCNHRALQKITNRSFLCASISDEDRRAFSKGFWNLNSWAEKNICFQSCRN